MNYNKLHKEIKNAIPQRLMNNRYWCVSDFSEMTGQKITGATMTAMVKRGLVERTEKYDGCYHYRVL